MTTEDAKGYLSKREIPQLFESMMTGLMYYRPENHIEYLQECLTKVKAEGMDGVAWNRFIEAHRGKSPLPPIGGAAQQQAPGEGAPPSPAPGAAPGTYGTNGRTKQPHAPAPIMKRESSSSIKDKDEVLSNIISDQNRDNNNYVAKDPVLSREPSELSRVSPLPPIGKSPEPGATYTASGGGQPAATYTSSSGGNKPVSMPSCPIVLMMGGPGSGRATHSKRLIERYQGWVHVSMGDLLRENIMDEGSANDKWDLVTTLVQKGEMAPEDLTLDLITGTMAKQSDAKGIILEGYPRTMKQVEEFEQVLGRVDLAFVLDCEEVYLQERLLRRGHATGRIDDNINAIAARIQFFKQNTLPAIKHWDDQGKLFVIDGDRDTEEIFYDLATIFDRVFYRVEEQKPVNGSRTASPHVPRPPSAPKSAGRRRSRPGSTRYAASRGGSRPGSGFTNVPPKVTPATDDTGRKEGMPQGHIVFVMGGPGSKRNEYCSALALMSHGVSHIDMGTVLRKQIDKNEDSKWDDILKMINNGQMAPEEVVTDLLINKLKKEADSQVILITGYPRDQAQVETFNTQVGGVTKVVLIDCDESSMLKTLQERAGTDEGREDDVPEAISARLRYYKYNTLPVIAHYDDADKLYIINGDKDKESVFLDFNTAVELLLDNQQQPAQSAQSRLEISPEDTGRQAGLATCPIISINGAPGSGAQRIAQAMADKYPGTVYLPEAEPTDTMQQLTENLQNKELKGVILYNYPRDKNHIEQFNENVGKFDLLVIVDSTEQYCRDNMESGEEEKLSTFRNQTLPVLGHYDDNSAVVVIDGDKDLEEKIVFAHKAVYPLMSGWTEPPEPITSVENEDAGRKDGLPKCPIVAIVGSPGSGVELQCSRVVEKYPGTVHVPLRAKDADTETVKSALSGAGDAPLVLLEGFPKNKEDIEAFNQQVGEMSAVLVLDCSQQYAESNMEIDSDVMVALETYKYTTLPVLSHYDDKSLLTTIDAETNEDTVSNQVYPVIDRVLDKPTGGEY